MSQPIKNWKHDIVDSEIQLSFVTKREIITSDEMLTWPFYRGPNQAELMQRCSMCLWSPVFKFPCSAEPKHDDNIEQVQNLQDQVNFTEGLYLSMCTGLHLLSLNVSQHLLKFTGPENMWLEANKAEDGDVN